MQVPDEAARPLYLGVCARKGEDLGVCASGGLKSRGMCIGRRKFGTPRSRGSADSQTTVCSVTRFEKLTLNAHALAENVNGSYENELVHTRAWRDVLEVEVATFEWVNWWSRTRLHQGLDYRNPVEIENDYWNIASTSKKMETRANA